MAGLIAAIAVGFIVLAFGLVLIRTIQDNS